MSTAFSNLFAKAKPVLRPLARATIGKLPAPAGRLTGTLAKDGGTPVRDVRLRPWAAVTDGNAARWRARAQAMFRAIYVGGVEGLPQPLAEKFAQDWARYCGCRYGIMLGHGTDALRVGLAAVLDHDGLDYGGEIIVPNFSFFACASAPLDRRFGVALVDVDPGTLLIDPKRVEEAIVPGKTRAILPVHLFGQPADMTSLRDIAKKHGLKILEDAAQAHGARWESGPVGGLGDAGAFSFQSSKNMASGEGGALVTNDEAIYERAYSMHNTGRALHDGGRWRHVRLGWNMRPSEYQAALLSLRLETFDEEQARRRANFQRLYELMREVTCLAPVAIHPGTRAHGAYMFSMRYKAERCGGLGVDQFLDIVRAEGAPIYRAFEATIAEQPAIRDLIARRPQYFNVRPTPVSDQAARDTVYIPQNVFLGAAADMDDIVAAIAKVERHYSGRRAV